MLDVFNASTARHNSTENKFRPFVLSRSFASGFSLALLVKDLTTALELAESTATPASFAARCRELWARAEADLERGADHTEIVRWRSPEPASNSVLTQIPVDPMAGGGVCD